MLKNSMLWNIITFNMAWFGLVFLGNIFIPIAAILLSAQLWYFQANKSDILFICLVAIMGIWLDFGLVYSGVFIFPDTNGIPFWLMALWLCFASTIRGSLAFLANSKILQLLVGALVAPLSYFAGAKFAVVTLTLPLGMSYLLLGCLWGPLMVVIFALSRWLKSRDERYVSQY